MVEENNEFHDKLYKIQEIYQRKDENFQKDQKNLERKLVDLQKNYEKLFQEYSSLDRNREDFSQKSQQNSCEISRLSSEIEKKTQENYEIQGELQDFRKENAYFRHDIKNFVMVLTAKNENYAFLFDLKSENPDLNLLKALILDLLQEKSSQMKKEKKLMKNHSNLYEEMRLLQEKILDFSPQKPVFSQKKSGFSSQKKLENQIIKEKSLEIANLTKELKQKELEKCDHLSMRISPNKASFLSEIKGKAPNFNRNNDMIMIIGSLLQILSIINTKFQWKNRCKKITSFSLDYFLRIHQSIRSASEKILGFSQLKTPKRANFARKNLRKFRKIAFVVIFAEILKKSMKKRKFYEEDPSFFQAKFLGFFPEDNVLKIAKNHFLLNNVFLNEITQILQNSSENLQGILSELLLIKSPNSLMKSSIKDLEFDSSIIDIDYCNLQRLFIEKDAEKQGFSCRKSSLKEKFVKNIENRVKTLNSEKKDLKKKLDGRSKKLEDAERKCWKKEVICRENEKSLMDLRSQNEKLKDSSYICNS